MAGGLQLFAASPNAGQVAGGELGSSRAFLNSSLLQHRTCVELLNGIDNLLSSVSMS